tara:strand:- start:9426 stop:9956 length:531 start_codon:yes stop_codon:yes gene_type:complete
MPEPNHQFLKKMYRDYNESLLRFLVSRLRDKEDALEVMQEAFQKLMTREDWEKMENPRAYLFQTAANLVVDRQRRQRRQRGYLREAANDAVPVMSAETLQLSPEQHVSGRQELGRIYRALEDLPEKCRTAFLLHRAHHKTYDQIARELDVSVSMVEKYMIRALKHLRRRLRPAEKG